MPDDFEDRLRSALRREASRLPFLVEPDVVDARLRNPNRRFPRWLSLAGVPALGAAAVIALALMVADEPRTGSPPSADACRVSPTTARQGWYPEAGGPEAFFNIAGTYYAGPTWKVPVRFDPAPRDRTSLAVWATRIGAEPEDAEDGVLHVGDELEISRFEEALDLPGSTFLALQRFPTSGCWTLHASVDGREVGSATLVVAPGLVQESPNATSAARSPSIAEHPLAAECDAARARGSAPGEVGGPHAFFDTSRLHARGRPPGVIHVRVDTPFAEGAPLIQGSIIETDEESHQATTHTANLVPVRPDELSDESLPGTHFRGDFFVYSPGCWHIRAVLMNGEIIGEAVVIIER